MRNEGGDGKRGRVGGRGGEQRERSKVERARTMQSRTEKEKENRERERERLETPHILAYTTSPPTKASRV